MMTWKDIKDMLTAVVKDYIGDLKNEEEPKAKGMEKFAEDGDVAEDFIDYLQVNFNIPKKKVKKAKKGVKKADKKNRKG